MSTDQIWTSDQRIALAIEREIDARMQPHTPPINVAVDGATVTLTGHVANQATKEALIQLARETEGVVAVIDDLVIGGGHPFLDWLFPDRNPIQDLVEESRSDR